MSERTSCATIQPLLSAHVDGELAPDESLRVMDHLASCVACAREHESMLELVRTARAALPRYPAPDVLRGRVRAALREARMTAGDERERSTHALHWPSVSRRMAVAGLILLGAGFGAGTTWLGVTQARRTSSLVPDEILASHIRSLMPGHLTDIVSSDQHTVKPWFDGRLDFSPVVARVDSAGFPLLGGRLDYAAGRPISAVVYERRKHIVNVFSWPVNEPGDAPVTTATRQGYNMLAWRSAGMQYWAVSDLNPGELGELVSLLRARGAGPAH